MGNLNHMLLYIVDKIPYIAPDVQIDVLGNVDMNILISGLALYTGSESNPDLSKVYLCYPWELEAVSAVYQDTIFVCINNEDKLPPVSNELNVLVFNTKYKLQYVFNAFQRLLQDIDLSYAYIQNALLENRDIQEALSIAEQIITNPFLLFDADFKLLGWSRNHECQDPMYQEAVENQSLSTDRILRLLSENILFQLSSNGKIELEAQNCLSHSPVIIRLLKNNEIVLGYGIMICSILPPRPPMVEGFTKIIDKFSLRLTNTSNKLCAIHEKHVYLLIDLINGRLKNAEDLRKYSETLHISLRGNFHLYRIDFNNLSNVPLNFAFVTLDRLVQERFFFLYGDHIIVIADDSRKEIHEERQNQYMKFLEDFSASCSISSSFHSLAELPRAYDQASVAHEFGNLFANAAKPLYYKYSHKFYDYLDFAECDVIRKYQDCTGCLPIHFPKLLQLLQEDKDKGTNYAQTLCCFLRHERVVNDTANELYLHRNSIINRIERLEKSLDIDLNDYATRSALLFTFRVIDYAAAAGIPVDLLESFK